MAGDSKPRRVGIIGFGHLGQYLTARIEEEGCGHGLELAFVWNRSREKMEGRVRREQQLPSLSDAVHRRADLVVEVAHPQITKEHGAEILKHADFMVGSPTAFADPEVEAACREAARRHGHTLYLPSGALWGAADIQRMADSGALQALKVTMSKHPDSFRLQGAVGARGQSRGERAVLYQGPVRALCPLAPNNVNTMAAAAMAAHNLGFDRVQGCLVSDPSLSDWHVVEVEVTGPVDEASGHGFTVKTTRRNPAAPGAVTGSATYASFWGSLLSCKGHGGKLFLC